MKKTQLKNSLLLLLTATIWGVAFVAQSVGMDHVSPFTFNAVRNIIGGIVLIPCIFFLDHRKSAQKEELPSPQQQAEQTGTLILGGVCCGILLALASSFQQMGIQYTTVGRAGFITACYIVIVPILGHFFLRKKCGATIWIAVALALAGLYLLCITDGFSVGKGDLLVMVCSLLFSLHILVIDYFSPKVDGVKMSCIQFMVVGVLSVPFMLILETVTFDAVIKTAGPILYAGVMSSGVAYTVQIIGQKGMNPAVASLILSLESSISVLSGWVLLGQTLSVREGIGCVLMFAAIMLAQIPTKSTGRKCIDNCVEI